MVSPYQPAVFSEHIKSNQCLASLDNVTVWSHASFTGTLSERRPLRTGQEMRATVADHLNHSPLPVIKFVTGF